MLTLLLGTDWVSNRSAMLDMLALDVSLKKNNRILMVPELISHDMERRLCAAAGDTACRYAEVLSFTRLAKRVADSVGHGALECLDNGGRLVAMAATTRQLHSKIKAYAAVETKPEFLTGLVDVVDEFKRCCISAADLLEASKRAEGSLAQKLEELALILECYNGVCQHGKKDPRDQMTWLLEELEDGSFAKDHVFYIDGFPDFTRQHMAILVHLIKESPNVVVSLNCNCANSELLAFEKAGETAGQLIRAAEENNIGVSICQIPARNDALLPLRNHLFQGDIKDKLPKECLDVCKTDTLYLECSAAAEKIIDLVREGTRYRQIGIVCADPGYSNTLKMILERCGVPAYFSGTEPVLGRSVIATVLAAMDAALGGFEKEDVIRYLKSPLSPLPISICDKVENYATIWSISGKSWLQPWQHHPAGLDASWDESSEAFLTLLEDSRKQIMIPLQELRDGLRDADNLGQQVVVLYGFLESISLQRRLSELADRLDAKGDNRNAQILNQLWDILVCALDQLYDVLGHTVWDTDAFCRLFKLLLSQYDVGTIPTVLDAVTVGTVGSMRCQQVDHLIVLGVQEGNMPQYGGSAGILSDQERIAIRSIGIPLTGGAMDGLKAEFADIYAVFCGAGQSVSVSCSSEQPSFVYRRLQAMSGGVTEQKNVLGPVLADNLEAGAYFARFGNASEAAAAGVGTQYDFMSSCIQHSMGTIKEENVSALYGDTIHLSASQIDKLADCRFHYFMRYGIRAKELKPITVDPAEFGTYVHAVLENTVREVLQLGGFHKVSEEDTLQIACRHSDEYATAHFDQLEAKRTKYLFKRNIQELRLIVQELWDELRKCEFQPVGVEVAFGEDGEIPSIDCSGSTMAAKLRGFVDRVDLWSNGKTNFFRVVDYKTGKKDFDYCDVFNGRGLQMLLYMFALERYGNQLLGEDPVCAGVQYFPARVPLISTDGRCSVDEVASLRESGWKRKGLLLDDDDVLMAMEGEETSYRMPYSRKKDGSISGDIADTERFEKLKQYIFCLLGKLVDDIASGNVEPNPYTRGSAHNACSYCPYGSVCHSASVEKRRNYMAMTSKAFWDAVEEEVNGRG